MKSIILFRAESEEYTKAFNAAGYQHTYIEPLSFIFINESQLKECLIDASYDGLVLTSPRAITAVARQWDTETLPACSALVYVLGAASAEDASRSLGVKARGTEAGNSEKLAEIIIRENKGRRFLFPCGNLASDNLVQSLKSVGLEVHMLPVYNTIENDDLPSQICTVSAPSAMVYFSPSGCQFVHKYLKLLNSPLLVLPQFAIGPTTAKALKQLGLQVAGVAKTPCSNDLLASLDQYFEKS